MPNVRRHRRRLIRRVGFRAAARRGAALVEIMIAITVMVIALTGVASMTVQAGKRGAALSGISGRTAVQTQVLDQLMVLPYTQLSSKAGCTTVSAVPYPHRRCITVTDVSFRRKQITVVFTPTSRLLRVDTLVFERSKGVSNSPL